MLILILTLGSLNKILFLMSIAKTSKVKRSYHPDNDQEERLQAAKLDVEQRKVPTRAAARLHKVRLIKFIINLPYPDHQIPYSTLRGRLHGRMPKKESNASQQILSKPQETALVDWIGHQASVSMPLDRDGIHSLAFDISGVVPGSNWISRFEKRHPEICASRPGNLDPKRAQNFNPTNVRHFYKLLKDIYDAFPSLPPEHVWNMDEKGVQFGGGRKRSKKYYHLRSMKRSKFYRIRSDNLELMTVIECVSPSGLSVPPSFVLSS
jgi:hypothetical protein